MPIQIVEIKARCSNQEIIRSRLKNLEAQLVGIDHQVDTYFNIKKGRLKLREGNIENFLIYYNREDKQGPKQSNVFLHKVKNHSSLKEILDKLFGVLTVVDKKREIYFIENVKFHIDVVKGLGSFVEIEAISKNSKLRKKHLLDQCNKYMKYFQINKKDLVPISYSDLLIE